MSSSVLYMSMSLDGYIAGPNDEPGNPGGDGFDRLHDWLEAPDAESDRPAGPAGQLWDEMIATGAVLAGRRTVEQVDHYEGHHHGVPIFVPSHRPPGPSAANYPLVTYVTDGIVNAMAQAKAAAGDRNVLVHGAYTAQRALEAGVLDELVIHQTRCCSVMAVGSRARWTAHQLCCRGEDSPPASAHVRPRARLASAAASVLGRQYIQP
jgi:dihydrofolate reductase